MSIIDPATQQLTFSASATSSAAGTATFDFPSIASGFCLTGTVFCQNAPIAATFSAYVGIGGGTGGTPWGSWGGSSIGGPIQCYGGQVLEVQAAGLTPSTSYSLQWTGSLDPSNQVQPISPAPSQSVLTSQTYQAPPSIVFGPTNISQSGGLISGTVTVPSGTRTLILYFTQVSGIPTLPIGTCEVEGVTSLIAYYLQPPYIQGQAGNLHFLVVVPIAADIDTSFAVSLTVGLGAQVWTMTASADPAIYDESVFYNGVAQPTQVVAAGTIKSGPFRLLTAALETSGGASIYLSNGTNGADLVVTTATGYENLTLPDNYIVPAGYSVIASGAVVQAGITWAYP